MSLALFALVVAACTRTSTPPGARRVAGDVPIPLAVRICDQTADTSAAAVLDAARLFARVATDPDAQADIEAIVGPVEPRERTLVSSGFFFWTLGVIPWVQREHRDVAVHFRRAVAGVPPCAPEPTTGGGQPAAGVVSMQPSGRMTLVHGWVALLLQPTPWWAADHFDASAPRTMRSRNLRLHTREAVSRAITARSAEIRALAGR